MNKGVKYFFLPIMIIAGIITSAGCALIVAPIALFHRLRERKILPDDLKRLREQRDRVLAEIAEANK